MRFYIFGHPLPPNFQAIPGKSSLHLTGFRACGIRSISAFFAFLLIISSILVSAPREISYSAFPLSRWGRLDHRFGRSLSGQSFFKSPPSPLLFLVIPSSPSSSNTKHLHLEGGNPVDLFPARSWPLSPTHRTDTATTIKYTWAPYLKKNRSR